MNINIIKKSGDFNNIYVLGNNIVEIYNEYSDIDDTYKIMLYRTDISSYEEIVPDMKKCCFVNIDICYRTDKYIYFATYRSPSKKTVDIQIRQYDVENKRCKIMFSFKEDSIVLTGEKKVKVFVLSPTVAILQTEIINHSESETLMGIIEFSLKLYNTDLDEPIQIVEENFVNNGINCIIPLNETEVLLKTGFSYLEDTRLNAQTENESLIESVFIVSSQKLIADISLNLTNIDMQLISSTYHDKYTLRPKVQDKYFYYIIVDVNKKESENIFYNIETGERFNAKNSNINLDDLYNSYVVNNTPYIRKMVNKKCEFINILTAENDISFINESFVTTIGRLFVCKNKHIINEYTKLYDYPQMDMVYEAKIDLLKGINIKDNYYLYVG